MANKCTNCKRRSDEIFMFRATFFGVYGDVDLATFMCVNCKEAFEWGRSRGKDDELYVEFREIVIHE